MTDTLTKHDKLLARLEHAFLPSDLRQLITEYITDTQTAQHAHDPQLARMNYDQTETENRHRDFVEQIAVPVYFCSIEGRIDEANNAMASLFGYTREELLGSSIEQ